MEEIGRVENMELIWSLRWRRNLFLRDLHVFENIISLLYGFILFWIEISEFGSILDRFFFFISISYHVKFVGSSPLSLVENLIISLIWITLAHSKVVVLSWQLLQDRLSSKDKLLAKRGVISDPREISYPL